MAGDSFSSTIAATNSNLSRLSKVVGSTAHSMVSSPYGDLSHTHFQDAMSDIARRPQFQKRLFTFNKRTPSELVRSTISRQNDIKHRVLTSIPDELLNDIPDSEKKFSLFQGFTATKEQETTEELESDLLALIVDGKGQPAKERATKKQLSTSDILELPLDGLKKEKKIVEHKLDLFEIRKELAANEIQEIDQRIAHLKSMRSIVFDRVAALEKEELELETLVEKINKRMEDGGFDPESPVDLGDLDEPVLVEAENDAPSFVSVNAKVIRESEAAEALLSASIYGKLGSAHEEKNWKQKRLHRHSTSRRKTMPTLQQYYEPGNSISVIQADTESITQLDFDIPFGTMVSASLEPTVKVWDLSKGEHIGSLTGHNASVRCLQLEDNVVVTGSADGTAKVWDISDLENPLVESLEAHFNEISALHFSDNTLVTGSEDKTIRQWDLQSGKCIQALDVLWAAAQTATGVYLDSPGKKVDPQLQSDSSFVGALQCFDAALASGTADGIVRLWDLRSGQVHRTLLGHTGPVTCLQFDDVHLATGSLDRSIRIWDLRTGTISDAFAYENPITSLHFDARRIVSTNGENTVKIYDREQGKHWSCGPGEDDENAAVVTFSRYSEGYLVEGRTDGKIGTWAC